MSGIRVMGIDLSQSATAAVCVPADWGLDWSRVERATHVEAGPKNATAALRISALARISNAVAYWAETWKPTHVWIEGYPAGGRIFGLDKLAEVGGVVRLLVRKGGIVAETAPLSTARKLLLGKLPRRDVKAVVHAAVRSLPGCNLSTGDELDAFVAANYGLSELGHVAIMAGAA
jgi:hypothetical protein